MRFLIVVKLIFTEIILIHCCLLCNYDIYKTNKNSSLSFILFTANVASDIYYSLADRQCLYYFLITKPSQLSACSDYTEKNHGHAKKDSFECTGPAEA